MTSTTAPTRPFHRDDHMVALAVSILSAHAIGLTRTIGTALPQLDSLSLVSMQPVLLGLAVSATAYLLMLQNLGRKR